MCCFFLEIRCVRVFFNPCPSFPMVPVGTDLLECKQPWITVGSLFPLHKATEPWEQPFIQLVIIRVYNTVTATQLNRNPTPLQLSLKEPINKTGNFCGFFLPFISVWDHQWNVNTTPWCCLLGKESTPLQRKLAMKMTKKFPLLALFVQYWRPLKHQIHFMSTRLSENMSICGSMLPNTLHRTHFLLC